MRQPGLIRRNKTFISKFLWQFFQLCIFKYRSVFADINISDVATSAFSKSAFHSVFKSCKYIFFFKSEFFNTGIVNFIITGGPQIIANVFSPFGATFSTIVGTKPIHLPIRVSPPGSTVTTVLISLLFFHSSISCL